MASALDMSLDDMIKKKGGNRNAGSGGKAAGVIKNTEKKVAASRRGGQKTKRGGQRRGGQRNKTLGNVAQPRMKVFSSVQRKVNASSTAAKVPQGIVSSEVSAARVLLPGMVLRVHAPRRRPTAAMAPAAKAAEAAARATAMKAISSAVAANTGREAPPVRSLQRDAAPKAPEKPAAPVASQARAPAKAKAPAVFTEDKLQMSLDEVIKTEVQKKKPAKAAEQPKEGAAADSSQQQGSGRKGRMRLRGGQKKQKAQGEAQAKAKAKGKAKAKAKAEQSGDAWGARQKDSAWGNKGSGKGWEDRKVQTGGMYSDWGSGGTKRKAEGGVAESEKWRRTASGPTRGWAGGAAKEFGSSWGNNGGGGSKLQAWGREKPSRGGESWGEMGRWADTDRWSGERVTRVPSGRGSTRAWADDDEPPARGLPAKSRATRTSERLRETAAPPKAQSVRTERTARSGAGAGAGAGAGGSTTIRVSNVPKNLDERDIKDAFEDTGKVLKCIVEKGVSFITFSNPSHAKKAVQTFDRGELNGQTIYVTMDYEH